MKLKNRLESIDALRGLMMILMALDHVRDYLGNDSFNYLSGNLKTNGLLFFTRWITNLCAPTFVFLVGVSMYLALKAGKTKKELSLFLVTRGLWLIVADFFLIHVAWSFSFDFSLIEFDVLTVTGAGMIVLAALLFMPRYLIFALCTAILISHNLLDGNEATWLPGFSWLHSPNSFVMNIFQQPITVYPWYVLLPWVVVPGLGYVFGQLYDLEAKKRAKWLIALAAIFLMAFIAIRSGNYYGDPQPWINHDNLMLTLFSFINVTKYPPSLLFFLMTLGLSFIILFFFERFHNKLTSILAVYGRVPFAFYVLHIFVIHTIGLILAYINFGPAAMKMYLSVKFVSFEPSVLDLAPYGYSLWVNYMIWILVIAFFYPFCKWYGDFKKKHKKAILWSYL